LILVMLLSSCAKNSPVIQTETKIIDTSCNWVRLITISLNDDIGDATARQILAHNRLVQKNCPKPRN
jgi:hypothetical protein